MIRVFEEHHEAYFAWKEAGIRGAWCWHVDAHLDVGREADPARLGNAFVPWGGLNCGNYLYLAIQEGIVGRLTWVVPPDLPVGSLLRWTREHVNGWFDLTVEESVGLRLEDGYVTGTVLGIRFDVGTAAALPVPTEPVLLDVDLDYYVTQTGEQWSAPGDFPPSLYTTVAWSVKGGWLPPSLRHLASPWVEDTSGYEGDALDRAAACVRFKRYEEALALLGSGVEAGYLRGTCFYHLGQHEQALATWRLLLEEELPVDGRAYVLGLASEAACTLDRPQEALGYAEEALALREDYRLYWASAAAYEKSGALRQATQQVRRALRLAEPYVFGLQMRAALARLYKKQEKHGLASLELAILEKADLGGDFRPLTLLR